MKAKENANSHYADSTRCELGLSQAKGPCLYSILLEGECTCYSSGFILFVNISKSHEHLFHSKEFCANPGHRVKVFLDRSFYTRGADDLGDSF